IAGYIQQVVSTVVVPLIEAQSLSTTSAAVVRYRGTRWAVTINDVGNLVGVSKIYMTFKRRDEADANAVLQLLLSIPGAEGDGLQRLNGAVTTKSLGSIEVQDYTEDDTAKKRIIAYV